MRKKSIGSSDAPVILGLSPWKTVKELWREKLGKFKPKINSAMERGSRLEAVARALFEFEMERDFPPAVCVHPKYDFLIASLDGMNEKSIVEIKCPIKAWDGTIPSHYFCQMQHQLFVTGAEINYFVVYNGHAISKPIEVKPDDIFIKRMLGAELKFWDCVLEKREPIDD